jgi:hypothetical protein
MRITIHQNGNAVLNPLVYSSVNEVEEKEKQRRIDDYYRKKGSHTEKRRSLLGLPISRKTKRRIIDTAFYVRNKVEGNLYFMTVTLPPSRAQKNGIECFESHQYYKYRLGLFIKELKKNYGLIRYTYVCELQRKTNRNAIHFHFLADFKEELNYLDVCVEWCFLIGEHHHYSKNCIDFEFVGNGKINDLDHIVRYMAKYISKNDGGVNCRVWGADMETLKYSKPIRLDTQDNPELERIIHQEQDYQTDLGVLILYDVWSYIRPDQINHPKTKLKVYSDEISNTI